MLKQFWWKTERKKNWIKKGGWLKIKLETWRRKKTTGITYLIAELEMAKCNKAVFIQIIKCSKYLCAIIKAHGAMINF